MQNKILLIDDDSRILTSFSRRLRREGFEVEIASSGEEALKMLDTIHPALIISDVRMPGKIDGIELMKQIPIKEGFFPGKILFTAFDDDEALSLSKLEDSGIFRVEKDRWETDFLPAIRRALQLHEKYIETWRQGQELGKLKIVHSLATTLEHDINNPLANIKLANESLHQAYKDQNKTPIIRDGVKRITKVISKLSNIQKIKEISYASSDTMINLSQN